MIRFILTLLLITFIPFFYIAQPFRPDKYGYVDSLQFKAFIAKRGYSVVGAFKDQNWDGNLMATVYKGTIAYSIDTNGTEKEIPIVLGFIPKLKGGKMLQTPIINEKKEKQNYLIINKKGKKGIESLDGSTLISPKYDEIIVLKKATDFPRTAFAVKKNKKWGIASTNGEITFPLLYDSIVEIKYCSDIVAMTANSKTGLISRTGTLISETIFNDLNFDSDLAKYGKAKSRSAGIIDLRTGKPVFKITTIAEQFYDNLFIIKRFINSEVLMGLYDMKNDREVLPAEYSGIGNLYDNSDGMFGIYKLDSNGPIKRGIADTSGKIIIPPIYDELNNFLDGWTICRKGEFWGILDTNNTFLVPLEYSEIKGTTFLDYEFISDVFVFKKPNGNYGLMDKHQHIIIEPIYLEMNPGETGIWATNIERKSGFLSYAGKILIPFIYKGYTYLNYTKPLCVNKSGIFKVSIDGKAYWIDLYGNKMEALK